MNHILAGGKLAPRLAASGKRAHILVLSMLFQPFSPTSLVQEWPNKSKTRPPRPGRVCLWEFLKLLNGVRLLLGQLFPSTQSSINVL